MMRSAERIMVLKMLSDNASVSSLANMAYDRCVRICDYTYIMQGLRSVKCPSVIEQVRLAVTHKEDKKGNGSGGPSKSRVLIDTDAIDLLTKLEHEWEDPPDRYGLLLETRIWAWWQWGKDNITEPEPWLIFIGRLEAIEYEVESLLNPARQTTLAFPCPVCTVRMVHKYNTAGELVQRDALKLSGTTGCLCLSCGAQWPPEMLEYLAHLLGCPALPC